MSDRFCVDSILLYVGCWHRMDFALLSRIFFVSWIINGYDCKYESHLPDVHRGRTCEYLKTVLAGKYVGIRLVRNMIVLCSLFLPSDYTVEFFYEKKATKSSRQTNLSGRYWVSRYLCDQIGLHVKWRNSVWVMY